LRLIKTLSCLLLLASPLAAQAPRSAIDWLSESVREKPVPPVKTPVQIIEVPEGIVPQNIEVTTLDAIRKDTVGLLPTTVTGLPREFWGNSDSATIADLIARQSTDSLPEILSLLYTILLAEVDAPASDGNGSALLLARVDKLLDLGALDQAQALLERAGPDQAEIFRRWFDVSLLTGRADYACTAMRAAPGFAPTLEARVFCLARNGDWNAAALTLATGETLSFISQEDADLMARFLDPGMYEGEPDLPPPAKLTPLVFTMREAIAQPRPGGALPLAFVNADLRATSPWRQQMEAAERLVRSQAMAPNRLIELYTARKAGASGGIWQRVKAIQAFDVALLSGDLAAIGTNLPVAFNAMKSVALEVPFAQYYGDRLNLLGFEGAYKKLAFELALLSDGYENAARRFAPENDKDRFLKGLAIGNVTGLAAPGTLGEAIAGAFLQPMPDGPLKDLLTQKNLGEAILRAMLLLKNEAFADPDDIRAALSTLRAVGLEEEARRIALQLLILERRG
jgi:hypothetical protein